MFYTILAGGFVVLFLALFFVSWLNWRKKVGFSSSDQKYISKHWSAVSEALNSNQSIAVINADKLLHYALGKRAGGKFDGLSFGEMLKKSDAYFADINAVWRAHKLRNRIAHQIDVKLNNSEVKSAISSFKRALRDLGANI